MNNHTDFILLPITTILDDAVTAASGMGHGLEVYPICDYVMQSVFLKMTGFQEQKLKCICWDIATFDYEFRYRRYTLQVLGECSSYVEKQAIYKDLVGLVARYDTQFDPSVTIRRETLLADSVSDVCRILDSTNLVICSQNSFNDFKKSVKNVSHEHFALKSELLINSLQDKYNQLYRHRNRCAHNTLSYQQNLPTLSTLFDVNYQSDNYFFRFFLLILVDRIFVELYQNYLNHFVSSVGR